jgi:hypothetical protein
LLEEKLLVLAALVGSGRREGGGRECCGHFVARTQSRALKNRIEKHFSHKKIIRFQLSTFKF